MIDFNVRNLHVTESYTGEYTEIDLRSDAVDVGSAP